MDTDHLSVKVIPIFMQLLAWGNAPLLSWLIMENFSSTVRKKETDRESERETLGCVWHKVHKHNSKHNSPKRPSFFSFHILDAGYSFVNKSKYNSLHITYQGINCRTCNVNVIKVTPKERHSWAISFLLLRRNILTLYFSVPGCVAACLMREVSMGESWKCAVAIKHLKRAWFRREREKTHKKR